MARTGTKRRELLFASAMIAAVFIPTATVLSAPQNGTVVGGQASISQTGTATSIQQTTNKAIINWQGFSTGANESVQFTQPSTQSVILNRVTGTTGSTLNGRLSSNGTVFLINPNGVMVGPTGTVDVGSFLATTSGITDTDFLAGRYAFTGAADNSQVANQGTIRTSNNGSVILSAPSVQNSGTISTPWGSTALGAAKSFTAELDGNGLLQYQIGDPTTAALVTNSGNIIADGGKVLIAARSADLVARQVINTAGLVEANSVAVKNGEIFFDGGSQGSVAVSGQVLAEGPKAGETGGAVTVTGASLLNQATISANGQLSGGQISVSAGTIIHLGAITADSSSGAGGNVQLNVTKNYLDTASAATSASGATNGGQVAINANGNLFSSGTVKATGGSGSGGQVNLLANNIELVANSVDASGGKAGGAVLIGGAAHGASGVRTATTSMVSPTTTIDVSAKQSGNGGTAVVWSDQSTVFAGNILATGGAGGFGGWVEVSSRNSLTYAGTVSAKTLLLDPENITVDNTGVVFPQFQLIDPDPGAGNNFGSTVVFAGSGKINAVVTSPGDSAMAPSSGAAYLFNAATGALISTLTGSTSGDQIGSSGITVLTNGNYVVSSQNWSNAGAANAGAVTWGSGTTGVTGVVSAANSLVGSQANDNISGGAIVALPNGNYVVQSPGWANGGNTNAGAVTWGSGTTGVSGVVSAANSLVGSQANDYVGMNVNNSWFAGLTVLTNGNYVVVSPNWANGGNSAAGAVTWGSGIIGVSGVVSAANSLVGSQANDYVGDVGVTKLSNGNYVVGSPYWANGANTRAGAVTWGSGTSGVTGAVSAANSLVGSHNNDQIGANGGQGYNNGICALTNGNYVVSSSIWANGANTNAGAVTWGSGTAGIKGVVSAANSLVGSQTNDQIGYTNITALPNGNYVVPSPNWANGANANAGAVTWGSGTAGVTGVVSAANSLVGSQTNDAVGSGGVVILTNNPNYVVSSSHWANGGFGNAGAATWGSGTAGISGVVSAANSLVGSQSGDNVGAGITSLTDGNYVVTSSTWANGVAANAGAATWGSGITGISGVVSVANSLVGSQSGDNVSGGGNVTTLTNGNYVVVSSNWANGGATNAGAVTWGSGTTGIKGVVSAANSLVGSQANDQVGNFGVTALTNGNYVVASTNWTNGGVMGAGAITWGSGTVGITGAVSIANSLVGSQAFDQVGERNGGSNGVTALTNGNYVVTSTNWTNGGVTNAGAVTWGSGTLGITGAVSVANSLVGSQASDLVGSGGVTALTNGNYVITSSNWANGGMGNAGAVTWGSGASGVVGTISTANSLVSATSSGGMALATNTSNSTFIASYPADATGRVFVGLPDPSKMSFATMAGQDYTIQPSFLTNTLSVGTAVALQANNDITINSDVIATPFAGNGGNLTLQAGRSILVNANVTTANGNLTLTANDTTADGVVDADRLAGAAVITMNSGTALNAGSGAVQITIKNGAGLTNSSNGDISLQSISASSVLVQNQGRFPGNIVLNGTITAPSVGTPIILETTGYFVNSAGGNALIPGPGSWQIYSAAPGADTFGGLDSGNTAVWNTPIGGTVTQAGNAYIFAYQPTATFTSTNVSKTYGSDASATVAAAYSVTGLQSGVSGAFLGDPALSAFSGQPSIASPGTPVSASTGSYPISISAGSLSSNSGYAMSFASSGTLSVGQATLTITANNASKAYGAANPTLSASYSGWVNGDDTSSLTTPPTLSTTATGASPVGSYPITPSGAVNPNYSITYVPGTLAVGQATLTITANNANRPYGSANPTLSAAYSGWVNGDDASSLTTPPTLSTTATGASPVGSYPITPSGAVNPNYAITYVPGTLAVGQAALTITANNAAKTYGAANPTLSASYSGWVNGDTSSRLTTAPTLSTTATEASPAGSYPITPSGAADPNYSFTYVPGTLSVQGLPTATTSIVVAQVSSNTGTAAQPSTTTSVNPATNVATTTTIQTTTISGALPPLRQVVADTTAILNGNSTTPAVTTVSNVASTPGIFQTASDVATVPTAEATTTTSGVATASTTDQQATDTRPSPEPMFTLVAAGPMPPASKEPPAKPAVVSVIPGILNMVVPTAANGTQANSGAIGRHSATGNKALW